jgi:M6 family metalloprotease-like protein
MSQALPMSFEESAHVRPGGARCFGWFVLLVALALPRLAPAAPYSGEEFTYHQPDGATFQIRLWGDEYYAIEETVDGYVVVRDPDNGFYCYARLSADGTEFVSTGKIVGQTGNQTLRIKKHLRITGESRLKKVREGQARLRVDSKGRLLRVLPDGGSAGGPGPLALPGSKTLSDRIGLVLLAEFPDRPGDVTISQQEVDNYCNQPGYTGFSNHGSVYDYFYKQSQGRLRYTSIVTAYFTALHNRDYYCDTNITYGTRARELITEGLNQLKAEGFDFSACDGNGDSRIDGVNTFYAGYCTNAWSQGLWPHRSGFTWTGAPAGINSYIDYQITDMRAALELGTYCHENGHMLCGFPDLYDYGYESRGAGQYSLMAYGGSGTWPKNVDSYLARGAGWCDVT